MDWLLLLIIVTAALFAGVAWHIGWEMVHDTKPRDPYQR